MDELLACSEDRLRRICAANDRNGEFEPCDRAEMIGMIVRWAAEEPDFWGTLRFLLGLAR